MCFGDGKGVREGVLQSCWGRDVGNLQVLFSTTRGVVYGCLDEHAMVGF